MDELKGKHIFIIEDNPTNMAVNAVTLKRTGAKITQDMWNTNPVDMLRQRLPVDVVLLDLMLKHNVSGYDVFKEIQADPELAHIPVIIVSAADPTVEIPKAQALGLAGYIGKPIQPRIFPQQIADCMNGKPVWYSRQDAMERF